MALARPKKRYRNEEFLQLIGAQVKRIRTKKGYSIHRLAKEGDRLSPASIHRVETGAADVQVNLLYRIAETLGVHVKEFFNFDMPQA